MGGGLVRRMLGLGLAVGALWAGGPASAQPTSAVLALDLTGVVDPFVASHVESAIADANRDGNAAVLLTIDTPGGLDSAMRRIVRSIMNSRVPVVCLVAPGGARAASAGTFVLMSCPVAAMAPGTNVGAAHPVGVSGAIELEKAENDAAAFLRSIAEQRGRNVDWAERAVRESVSASAEEALDLDVIDLVAPDIPTLLARIDGRPIEVGGGDQVVLRTTGLTLERRGMGAGVALLHTLLDPNLAFIFFYLGLALLVLEFFVPGGVLGVLGGVLLVLAVIALGMLPVQLLGIVLLIASVAFFLLELKLPGTAIGTGLGLASLVLGGLFLFDSSVPSARVSPFVIAPVAAFAGLFFVFVIRAAIRMHGRRAVSDTSVVLGAGGTTLTELAPSGVVLVAAEEWTAESEAGVIPRGTAIRVVGIEGLRLRVVPVDRQAGVITPATPVGPAVSHVPEGGTG
jgi:membrane-bound serine protease (ClpP class)